MLRILTLLLIVGLAPVAFAGTTVDAIRDEATRPSVDEGEAGRPLPLAATWAPGNAFSPMYQLEQIAQGHHLLLCFRWPTPDYQWNEKMRAKAWSSYWEPAVTEAARLKLPISFQRFQFEMELTRMDRYRDLPPAENPNVIDLDGKVIGVLDPMGPIDAWRDWGRRMIEDNAALARIQRIYPEPPLVMFVSNNEHNVLRPEKAETSLRFVERYGTERDIHFKRRVFREALIDRYRVLQESMREALVEPGWREHVRFIAYEAFAPSHVGRWYGWQGHSYYTPDLLDWSHQAWDGSSPSYYTHHWAPFLTDYTSSSIQTEAMNWVFHLRDVHAQNPDYWFELSTWDGDMVGTANSKRLQYAARGGQVYTAQRYEGMLQFGLWLMRPRVLRDFRYLESLDYAEAYFMANVLAVDRVWNTPTLREFWRHGELVANPARDHPYRHSLPDHIKSEQRWFALSTSVDPAAKDWGLYTEIPVFAIARVLGEAPKRRWLVYAHAPRGARTGVEVQIPGFSTITIDASLSGSFYLVEERGGAVQLIDAGGPASALPVASTQTPAAGQAVTLRASDVLRPEGRAVTLHWDLGDGTTARGPRVEHRYARPGQYVVALTTEPERGRGTTHRLPIAVGHEPNEDALMVLPLDRMPDAGIVREIRTEGGHGRAPQTTHLIYAAQPLDLLALNHGCTWADDPQRGEVLYLPNEQHHVDLQIYHDANYNPVPRYDALGRNRTISVWFKVEDAQPHQVVYQEGSSNASVINLYVEGGRVHAGTWSRHVEGWPGEWVAAPIDAGDWHHAVLVLDDAQNAELSQCFRFYLDGELVGEATSVLNRPHWVRLGGGWSTRLAGGEVVEKSPSMRGWLDDVSVFKVAMDDRDVQALYRRQHKER
jgi:hypothetical protein